MLKVFRDNLKKLAWVLWIVIAAFIAIEFTVFGNANQGVSGGSAVRVGDDEIAWTEYQRRSEQTEQQLRELYGDQWNPAFRQQARLQAVERLINDHILLREARRLGLQVSDAEVRKAILSIPGFTDPQGRFVGTDVYEGLARANRFSGPAELEETIRQGLLLEKLRVSLESNIYVSDADVEQAYRDEVDRATIRYVQVPRGQFAAEARVDRAALEAYYEANQETYRRPEQRVIDYLLVDKGLLRNEIEISEADERADYDSHAAEYSREEEVQARHILLQTDGDRTLAQARAEIEAIRRRIEGGEDFAAIARTVSEDPGSGANGGDLGFFGRGRMTPEFERAAFEARPGQLVGPIETPFGVHLIEVTDRREGGKVPFEEVRESVRARLASERVDGAAEALAAEVQGELAALAPAEVPARMQALSESRPALRYTHSAPFGREGMIAGLGRAPELAEAAFALEAGELMASPVASPRGPVVVRLDEVREAQIPPLAEIEPQVRAAVERDAQQRLVEERLSAARTVATGEGGLAVVAAELGVEVVDSQEFGRGGAIPGLGVSPAVVEGAMAAEVGDIVGPLETPVGAVLFEVVDRKGFDPQELASRREEIRQQLAQQSYIRLLTTLIQKRRQQDGVRYSDEVVEQIGGNPAES